MNPAEGATYDPETLDLLRSVLDDAWARIPPQQRCGTSKSDIAVRILKLAAHGERDPVRLKTAALLVEVSNLPA